jgi:hypothetical protein
MQEFAGRESRDARCDGIQKLRLVTDANGIRFVEGRHTYVSKMLLEGCDGVTQQLLAVAEVAAEGYGDRDHAREYRFTDPRRLRASSYRLPTTS